MLSKKLANLLLYVPFNEEYPVPTALRDALTMDEFFRECYYHPEFTEEIKKLESLSDEKLYDLEYPLDRSAMISLLQEQQGEEQALLDWLDGNGTGVYCVSGDAGTGKSTYLHHLKHSLKMYQWDFLDLQKAKIEERIMGYSFEIPCFSSLFGKIMSLLINTIVADIFVQDPKTHRYNYQTIYNRILKFRSFYKEDVEELYPDRNVAKLYEIIIEIDKTENERIFCENSAKAMIEYFSWLCNAFSQEKVFSLILEHFLIYLQFLNPSKKHIIVFDNLERYVGTDEIYNDQIITFFTRLRAVRDYYNQQFSVSENNSALFPKHFQFIVAMRNTTVRMFTPQQNADFISHTIDLSEWFSIDRIIENKMKWFDKHPELLCENNIELQNRLMHILADQGQTGNILRGLRLKLNMLFNNDKRLICDFLISALNDVNNAQYLSMADMFKEHSFLSESLKKFAYRSIVWRIVINKLNQGTLFQSIYELSSPERIVTELDYVRKILTILSNYSLVHPHGFMSFTDLLVALYPNRPHVEEWFYSPGCANEKSQVSRLLYLLNCYDRRHNDWFKFIDIQCNSKAISGIHIKDADTFETTILSRNILEDTCIQITTAGKAYLGYVVQSFEFISCVSENTEPLLCTVPKAEWFKRNLPLEKLPCIEIVSRVAEKSKYLIRLSQDDIKKGYGIFYRKNKSDHGSSYAIRIRNAHRGYINNFCELIAETMQNSENISAKHSFSVISKLREISLSYSKT